MALVDGRMVGKSGKGIAAFLRKNRADARKQGAGISVIIPGGGIAREVDGFARIIGDKEQENAFRPKRQVFEKVSAPDVAQRKGEGRVFRDMFPGHTVGQQVCQHGGPPSFFQYCITKTAKAQEKD